MSIICYQILTACHLSTPQSINCLICLQGCHLGQDRVNTGVDSSRRSHCESGNEEGMSVDNTIVVFEEKKILAIVFGVEKLVVRRE